MLGTKSSNYYLLNMPFVVLISHMAAKIIILFNKSSFWLILKSSIGLCGLTQSLKQHFTLMHFLQSQRDINRQEIRLNFWKIQVNFVSLIFSKNLMKIKKLSKISLQIADWNEYNQNASQCTYLWMLLTNDV